MDSHQTNVISGPRQRLGYIDAMRAFAIFMVVYGHVELFCTCSVDHSLWSGILTRYHMPLFFFISGFVAYRPATPMSIGATARKIGSKAVKLLSPPLIFLGLLYLIQPPFGGRGDVIKTLNNGFFCGFWYTISLFWVLAAYNVTSYLMKRFDIRMNVWKALLVTAFLAALPLVLPKFFKVPLVWNICCGWNTVYYVQYFAFGLFAARYKELFFSLLSRDWVKTAVAVTFVGSAVWLFAKDGHERITLIQKGVNLIMYRTYPYAAILLTVVCFHAAEAPLSGNSRSSRILRYVGRNTLPIYLIHYFFIWRMDEVGTIVSSHNGVVLDLLLIGCISLVLIALSLLTASIFRHSQLLNRLLFAGQ